MQIECIPFKDTGYFSNLLCDYLDEKEQLKPFYNRFPRLEDFEAQMKDKENSFLQEHRSVLVKVLNQQYEETTVSEKTSSNIALLAASNTFTVVTGHQLNLFTGPLYFLYKIISTINLTEKLKKKYPGSNFVPVYWMATEDHDFDEINYFNFRGKKMQWNYEASGAVGRLPVEGLDAVLDTFSDEIGSASNAETLKKMFRQAYLEHATLTGATRYLANFLFGAYGLVIVDGDHPDLKRLLIPYAKKDIFENLSFNKVTKTIEALERLPESYGIQVNPREINYFYVIDGLRERIVAKEDRFHVLNTNYTFSKNELLSELERHPERFSPNVIARPLYQEVILPNLCYIGGGGELAYWLQLKSSFEAMKVVFPILLLRNSVLMMTEKQYGKLKKMDLSIADLFLKQNSLINKKIRAISNIDIDFSPQKKLLEEQFKALYEIAEKTDESFLGAVKAQEVKQKKGLDKLEKRLLKAQKRKLKDHVVRLTELQNQLFPNQSLQERTSNFSELYLDIGDDLIPLLVKTLDPLQQEFLVLQY